MNAMIYGALRSPRARGKSSGSLHSIRPVALGSQVLNALMEKSCIPRNAPEDVIMGCVTPVAEQGANVAKLIAQYAGLPDSVAGMQINRFCSSGLEAVNLAAAQVISGINDWVLAGGIECMSRIPMGMDGGAWMIDPDVSRRVNFVPQGISADLLAYKFGISRKEADEFALESQRRAILAWEQKRFAKSIVAIKDDFGNVICERDEHFRPDTTLADLAALKPSFEEMGVKYGFDAVAISRYPEVLQIDHIHHAGNSSGIVDGAAFVLIGSDEAGKKLGIKPRAKIRAMAVTSTEPTIMLAGPAPATRKVLKKAGMEVSDIDLFEINEAFAAVVIHAERELGISNDKVNVNGGAIALGHPLGATGAMLIGTALDELDRTNKETALVTLCVGGGMGVATVIERCEGGK